MSKTPIPRMPPIAIIGMGCFFPKSPGLKAYWRLLINGIDAITDIPHTHWSPDDFFDEDPKKPDHVYCKRGGFLDPVDFDPAAFGIPPSNMEATDTSQLLGLLAARQALDDAGYTESADFDRDRTAVILGVTGTQEMVIPLGARLGHPVWKKALDNAGIPDETASQILQDISDAYVPWKESSFPGLLGNVVAGRIANRLNLGGTNCVVDAACASSMSAVNHAILELCAHRADMVITGGVDTLNDIFMHMCFAKSQILSPTGDVRPFSKDADGTLLGEGVGFITLKRLADAKRDRDQIYAVIKGIGSSSDGRSRSIYAPRAEGQTKALRRAYETANIRPESIGLVETHGTGTRVGDAVEVRALTRVLDGDSKNTGNPATSGKNGDRSSCAIGSVKSMIGHTKAAAGAAGLIKAALALYHKALPPTLKAGKPDPGLHLEDGPFYLSSSNRPWFAENNTPRRAGVSAFGFGGSNYHLVLEEYVSEKKMTAWDGSVEITAFSGKSTSSLCSEIGRWQKKFARQPSPDNFKKMAAESRASFRHEALHRLILVADLIKNELTDAGHRLDNAKKALTENGDTPHFAHEGLFYANGPAPGKIAFMFPGQGSQYVDMGKHLVTIFPEAFHAMTDMENAFVGTSTSGKDRLTEMIYPIPAADRKAKAGRETALRATRIAQPAIGAVSLGMINLLHRFNVLPDAACGHSYGELPALFAGGRIDRDALCRMSVARGRFMADAGQTGDGDPGAMLAVKAPLAELRDFVKQFGDDVILANLNSPGQGVLSGTTAGILAAQKTLKASKTKCVKLPVAAAFHSRLVASAQAPFQQLLDEIDFSEGRIPVMSNSLGAPYPADPSEARAVLGKQIIRSVEFVKNVEHLYESGIRTFVEIGPKAVLISLAAAILKDRPFHAVAMDGSGGKKSGLLDFAECLSRLAVLGYPVDLVKWDPPSLDPESNHKKSNKPKMTIPISGANYRSRPLKNKTKTKKTKFHHTRPETAGTIREEKNTDQMVNNKPVAELHPPPVPESTAFPRQNAGSRDLLHVVREGLQTIEKLQTQTAEAHQKFLETQGETAKILQTMMANAGQMTGMSLKSAPAIPPETGMGTPSGPPVNAPVNTLINKPDISETSSVSSTPPVIPKPSDITEPHVPTPDKPQPTPTAEAVPFEHEAAEKPGNRLKSTLLDVVSDLTGYPTEMLGLDMDIEADLGIDSIKRVEILSALEERLPGLPRLPPEILGSLKTLGQICSHLDKENDPDGTRPGRPEESPNPSITENVEAGMSASVGKDASVVTDTSVLSVLITVVSELTGYPEEMLETDMDIEADLGIDSIKRVEILSTLEEKCPGLPQISPETLGTLKTLGQIAGILGDTKTAEAASTNADSRKGENASKGSIQAKPSSTMVHGASPAPVFDVVISPETLNKTKSNAYSGDFLIVGDDRGIASHLAAIMKEKGFQARLISPASEPAARDIPDHLSGLILTGPINPQNAFQWAKFTGPKLIDQAGKGHPAIIASVTRMDGAFGFGKKLLANPEQGALSGLIKTAVLEWGKVIGRSLDISSEVENHIAAGQIFEEIIFADSAASVEVGLGKIDRVAPKMIPGKYGEKGRNMSAGDVWIVTGGARGITAACARALAATCPSTLILLGRSPEPEPEPSWLAGKSDPADIKAAILSNEFQDAAPTPITLEKAYQQRLANREISRTLDAIGQTGKTVKYVSVDICDGPAVKNTVVHVQKSFGPVTGIVHGAGVLRDGYILDKSTDAFRRVYETKVNGLAHVMQGINMEKLNYLIVFSSVAARMGNPGQADYAMANEVLNKMARQMANTYPDCRVSAINWGPWDGGMVTPSLKRLFEKRGVVPISMEQGVESFLRILDRPASRQSVEIVIGDRLIPHQTTDFSQSFQNNLDIRTFPILSDHRIDGIPEVPLALLAEWYGHGAIHGNPGLRLLGIDDLEIRECIRLDETRKNIRMMAGKTKKRENVFEVEMEARNGRRNGVDVIHSSARAILCEFPDEIRKFSLNRRPSSVPYHRSRKEIYDHILDAKNALRGILKVTHCDQTGMIAEIATAPAPDKWVQSPLRSRWLGDPLAVEAALQMVSLWGYEQYTRKFRPRRIGAFRQFRHTFPGRGLTAVLESGRSDETRVTADITIIDTDHHIIATLKSVTVQADAGRSGQRTRAA